MNDEPLPQPPTPDPQPTGGWAQPPVALPPGTVGYGFVPPRPSHPKANTSLVLGIVSVAGGFVCCGIPFLLGPVAWVLGHKGLIDVDAHPGSYSGRESLVAGRVLGIISTVLLVPWLFIAAFYIAGVTLSIAGGAY